MNVSGVPKEILDKESVQRVMEMLRTNFKAMFETIDTEVIPNIKTDIPEKGKGMEAMILPMMKIQYANVIQMAFNETYQEYINNATFEFSHGAMFGGGKDDV